jgi:predicted DNA-binding protein (UPF0251 family)
MMRCIEDELMQRETLAEWSEALTDAQREAVRLCWVEGYTQEEAAQMLGVTQPALSMRLENARKGAEDLIKRWRRGVLWLRCNDTSMRGLPAANAHEHLDMCRVRQTIRAAG